MPRLEEWSKCVPAQFSCTIACIHIYAYINAYWRYMFLDTYIQKAKPRRTKRVCTCNDLLHHCIYENICIQTHLHTLLHHNYPTYTLFCITIITVVIIAAWKSAVADHSKIKIIAAWTSAVAHPSDQLLMISMLQIYVICIHTYTHTDYNYLYVHSMQCLGKWSKSVPAPIYCTTILRAISCC